MTVYVDSSALVKLVVAESESRALQGYLRRNGPHVTCVLARTEVVRAVRGIGPAAVVRAGKVLARVQMIRIDEELTDAAARLQPDSLRSLDAIHMAAAECVRDDITAVVTYDRRMQAGAEELGFTVAAPGAGQ